MTITELKVENLMLKKKIKDLNSYRQVLEAEYKKQLVELKKEINDLENEVNILLEVLI